MATDIRFNVTAPITSCLDVLVRACLKTENDIEHFAPAFGNTCIHFHILLAHLIIFHEMPWSGLNVVTKALMHLKILASSFNNFACTPALRVKLRFFHGRSRVMVDDVLE